jgi:hypothetical protein
MIHHGRNFRMISAARRVPSRLCPLLAVVASATACALPSTAAAASNACPPTAVSQPFSAWGDTASYALAPGGDFESSAWGLDGGAALAAGSEPFAASGVLGAQSLSLPAGAEATSRSMCLDAGRPTLRLFASGGGVVEVEMLVGSVPVPVGVVAAPSTWAPSPILLTGGSLLGPLSGGSVSARIRISARSGDPRIDDVFVDPWNRG